jgi:hypothetical protein
MAQQKKQFTEDILKEYIATLSTREQLTRYELTTEANIFENICAFYDKLNYYVCKENKNFTIRLKDVDSETRKEYDRTIDMLLEKSKEYEEILKTSSEKLQTLKKDITNFEEHDVKEMEKIEKSKIELCLSDLLAKAFIK